MTGFKGSTKAASSAPGWTGKIPADQWAIYRQAIQAIRGTGAPFLVGGGFAFAAYTQYWRNTKDIDFYVLPQDRSKAVAGLSKAGFVDYYPTLPYDRGWIYRSTAGGVIVDIIWSMANRRAQVDQAWFERAAPLQLREELLHIVPVEELVWSKMYVLQHDHCDWPDVLNILYAQAAEMDWHHLLKRVEVDQHLLKAVLTLFDWLCPNRAGLVPKTVRTKLRLAAAEEISVPGETDRPRLLDSRAWFIGRLPANGLLEI